MPVGCVEGGTSGMGRIGITSPLVGVQNFWLAMNDATTSSSSLPKPQHTHQKIKIK